MEKQEFIKSILEGAMAGFKEYHILPSLTIAQAILESNWGKSTLSAKGNNLFGMKATASCKDTITLPTYEYVRGEKVKIDANFKAYPTLKDSILDHNILLRKGKRYQRVRDCNDYNDGAMALYSCGYATDPEYPQKLISIIEEYDLYKYDIQNFCFFPEAYDFVTKNNISDGARPKDAATREEVWAMAYRLSNLFNKTL